MMNLADISVKIKEVPSRGPISASIEIPGSKSITNRALILAALSDGETDLEGTLDCDDTRFMLDALRQLGITVTHDAATHRMTVGGRRGRFPNRNLDLYIGNSGTTARFLTAALTFAEGDFRIHGKPRMHRRPIGDLINALEELGGRLYSENNDDCPPLTIHGVGGQLDLAVPRLSTVSGSISSQFLSALLMAAPVASAGGEIKIEVAGRLVSKPYITMTLRMMEDFGVSPWNEGDFTGFRFERDTVYRSPGTYKIEPDASAASYFFAAAAVCGGTVTVRGLSHQSLQGDIAFVDCLQKMGCTVKWTHDSITVRRHPEAPLHGVSIDMNSCSDTAQTLAVVALFAEGPTEIVNVEHIRLKETDRIADLATELRRFGAGVEERRDGLRIVPPEQLQPASVRTYDDHRMAMSFAVAGLRLPGVRIEDPDCVQKTFPAFFEELAKLG